MLKETIELETLRQIIEDAEYKVGDQTDYLSYGKPSPAQAQETKQLIEQLKIQSGEARGKLKQLLNSLRSQQPQAIEEWVKYHIDILQTILEEKTDAVITPRKNVAKETIQNWEKVRAGELDYVNINWHFLKDYKASVRDITGRSTEQITPAAPQKKTESKSSWKFWK